MIGRLLYFLVGRPGIRRSLTMRLMCRIRRTHPSSELLPDSRFIRTIQSPDHLVKDELTGLYRVSSKAFHPSRNDGTLSGDLEQLLTGDGLTVADFQSSLTRVVGKYGISISQVRARGLEAEHRPVIDNWYHGAICGNFTQSKERQLYKDAIPIMEIDQLSAENYHYQRSQSGASTSH